MAKPARNANPNQILSSSRTFFVTTKTSAGRALLQSERNATLLIEVLRSYAAAKKFKIHDFFVMPDHVHLLITVDGSTTIERAVQFVKGGFSYRMKRELGHSGEIWQRGFSEQRIYDRESYLRHREYIAQNPVRAGLVDSPRSVSVLLHLAGEIEDAGAKA
jgi:putative transposase